MDDSDEDYMIECPTCGRKVGLQNHCVAVHGPSKEGKVLCSGSGMLIVNGVSQSFTSEQKVRSRAS